MSIWYAFLIIIALIDFAISFASILLERGKGHYPVIFVFAILLALASKIIEDLISRKDSPSGHYRRNSINEDRAIAAKSPPAGKNISSRSSQLEARKNNGSAKLVAPKLHNYQTDIPARLVALAGLLAKGRISIEEYETRRNRLISTSPSKKQRREE